MARHRRLVIAAICLASTALVLLGRLFPTVPFLFAPWLAEQRFYDLLRREGRVTPERDDFVFIGIDQQSLQLDAVGEDEIAASPALQLMKERAFPWSREVWALLLDRLFAAGARMVVFDMIFSPPNDGDPAFAAALHRYGGRVVVGANFDESRDWQLVLPNSTLIPPPQQQDDRVGFVNFLPDATDAKVREVRFFLTQRQLAGQSPFPGDEIFAALSTRALAKLGHTSLPQHTSGQAFRFGPSDAYQPKKLYEVFLPKSWERNFGDGKFFKDKVVMVGASAQVMHDVVDTPMGPSTPGPALHLHAMAAALAGEFLRDTTVPVGIALLGGGGGVAWLLVAFVRRPLFSIVALLSVAVAYLVAARVLYDTAGFFLFTVPVLCALIVGGGLSLGFEYALERAEKQRTRRTLERYVSKNLVRDILDNPTSFYSTMKGARIPVTVLFSDLIGFTTLSERADPEELVRQLNEYLSRMVGVVFENNGTLDKFIGDAIMAVWGNVQSNGPAADAKACAYAAVGMRRALKELNAGWQRESRMPLGMGIGINHGEAIAGNIGSGDRADLTVIGDAVNLASRLEALTRNYGLDILVGAAAAELIRDEFHLRSVAKVQVKGKTVPVEISTIVGAKREAVDGDLLKWLEVYEEGIAKFRARNFTGAKILLARFLEFYPDDYLAKMYLARTLEYEQQPPDESWNAAELFTKK